MHLPPRDLHGLDDGDAAVELEQSPADLVFLSFSDSDLRLVARCYESEAARLPSLRCASLAQLKHPYSVDLYLERICAKARLIVVRLLGGKDYWPYGVDELAALARMRGVTLAIIPGDGCADPRLEAASTLAADELARIGAYFAHGGPANIRAFLHAAAALAGFDAPVEAAVPVANAGRLDRCRRVGAKGAARALIIFYRSTYLADDVDPVLALVDALAERGFCVDALYVQSLRDEDSARLLRDVILAEPPDIALNATAFSARGEGGGPLDLADAPVLQVALATTTHEAWARSTRGATGADLAMNVVLPELDGRIFTRAISFKETAPVAGLAEFSAPRHAPEPSRVDFVAALAANWARLRRKANADKRLALILSDYPAKRGRGGYAIGLDAAASLCAIVEDLREAGYAIGGEALRDGDGIMRALETGAHVATFPLDAYRAALSSLPVAFVDSVTQAWGDPMVDPACRDGAFRFSCLEAGALAIALQPDRGARADRDATYHDLELPPRHAFLAFYFWLRFRKQVDAIIHLGTHGSLEWLPGKSAMLSQDCAPEAALGPTPLIYPYIVNDPGEAAQAKRRLSAVTIGHLTPDLVEAGSVVDASEIESLLDEYANAASFDRKRAARIAAAIIDEAERVGLAAECGVTRDTPADEALATLDAWLCDVKEMRIGDGLHVFGRAQKPDAVAFSCAQAESRALLRALGGRFIEPGPAGSPSRGRLDVLPTGRNLYCIDPRCAPTRIAFDIGRRAALDVATHYAQQHGDWPKSVMLDLWGSATIRTGGEDFAQALALIGVVPLWDGASARVSGFEIEPLTRRDYPRIDVTLHVSGVFRDMFPGLIALFHDAARAVASLEEDASDNPLRAAGASANRVFGAAPGRYGLGISETILRGGFANANDLGASYLDAAGHAFDRAGEGAPAHADFAARVAGANALLHVQDMADVDILSGPAFTEFEGGFVAANRALGGNAQAIHLDATRPDGAVRLRALSQEIARSARARLANPRWLRGQMRHGHRGGAEIAEGVDNLFGFAATTGFVSSEVFDCVFDATLGDEEVRGFLASRNPRALESVAQVFSEARRRGWWRSRRNSVDEALSVATGAG